MPRRTTGFANRVPRLFVKQGITVTSSLPYPTISGFAAPPGPLLGYRIADRFERRHGFAFIAGPMTRVMLAIGPMGRGTLGQSRECICH